MKNDILFIAATHGDEQIGVEVLQNISQKRKGFDWIIGNQEAFRRGKRLYQKDLNRSGLGDITSPIYEERRAAEIQEIAKEYKYTIDLHGAINACGVFTIITNPSKENLALASILTVDTIVIWPSITKEMQSPLSEFFPCGLEIECGNKYDKKTHDELYRIVTSALDTISTQTTNEIDTVQMLQALSQKRIYLMYGDIKKQELSQDTVLQEFCEIQIEDELFTPVFIGTYDYSDIVGYKLRRLTVEDIQDLYLRD